MFNVEVPNPTNGAAFQVLYERFHPAFCASRERQKEILAEFSKISEWASTQPMAVKEAYLWAIKKHSDDIEHRLKINDLGNQVQEVVKTIAAGANVMTAAPLTSPAEILDAMFFMVQQSVLSGLNPKSIQINRAALQALGPKDLARFKVCYPNVEIEVVYKDPTESD